MQITVYSRNGCHLCDDAIEMLAEFGLRPSVVDIDTDPKLVTEFGCCVPVVEIDGRVLIDGGVVNNYPLDEVAAMGADVMIGVDVQHGLVDREALSSATGILLQINNYRTVSEMVDKSARTDVYIKPAIADFSVIDFDKGREIIRSGELAGAERFA